MSNSIDQKLALLESNLSKLLTAYNQKNEALDQLKSENILLQSKVEGLEAKVSDFQNQDKMAKLVNNTSVEREESIELKNRLNEYIKEIDRCIAHLS